MQQLPLVCLMLILLCRDPGVGAQRFIVHQPQDKVSVVAGEMLTLNCTASGMADPGPVKWLKGWGSGNKTIYNQRTPSSYPSVMRVVSGSNTDFTIHIRNVTPEDTGTYYCVKFTKNSRGEDELFAHGRGTEVSMQGENFLSSLTLLGLGILLEKALLGGLFFFFFKHMKSKAREMLPYPAPPHSLAS